MSDLATVRKANVERDDYLPEETPLPDDYAIDGDDLYIPADDTDQLEDRIREWAYCLRHIGGVITVAAHKKEIAPSMWVTQGFAFKWNSYAPGERLKDDRKQENGQGSRSGRRGKRRDRDVARETREQRPTVPEVETPEPEPEQEELEPDGGTVVDESVVDPDNADIRPDVANDPSDVLAGNA